MGTVPHADRNPDPAAPRPVSGPQVATPRIQLPLEQVEIPLRPPPLPPDLLREAVNQELAKLGSSTQWKRVPPFVPEMYPLFGKPLTVVDDTPSVIDLHLPPFMVATNGFARGVLHRGEPLDTIVERLLEASPRIVVIDYRLACGLTGDRLIARVKPALPESIILGFSSDPGNQRAFMNAGAHACVAKGDLDPVRSVLDIARAVERFSRN